MRLKKGVLKSIIHLFLCWLAFFQANSVFSQQDSAFWFTAPEVSSAIGDNPIYLRFLTYDSPATVTVSQPANLSFTPVTLTIPANSFDTINLSLFLADVESPAADIVANNGLKITSTALINAYYELNANANKEVFSLKGSKALGTNFYTPFQTFWDNLTTTPSSFSSIEVVATEDSTTILVTPRTDVVGHSQNLSFSVLLNEGETYSIRDTNVSVGSTLAGSIVSSDKPVAVTVYSGALSNAGCASTMGDQITSADYAGTDFIVHKGNGNHDRIYILATQNGTTININDGSNTTTLINWSETYEYVLTSDIQYIRTNKPVYLWHASGAGCNLAGAQVPNIYCAGTDEVSFTRSSSDSLGLILYTRTGFEGMFTLNGNAALIPSTAFNNVPGTNGDFKVAFIDFSIVEVPLNSYNKVENSGDIFGMGILQGSHSFGSGYAYFSEFNSEPFVSVGIDDSVCANVPFPLNGVVGGGPITGVWSGTGFGSFQNGANSLVNSYIASPLDTLISPVSLILTSGGPCLSVKDTLLLDVTSAPIVNASADQSVCENNANVQLNGSIAGGASEGVWSTLGSGIFLPNDSALNAMYIPSNADTANGLVTLVLTSIPNPLNSCLVVSDTMNITITKAPVVAISSDTISVCSNNALVNLTGSVTGSSTTGKWITTGNGLFLPDNLSLNATYQPSLQDITSGIVTIYLESTSNGNCLPIIDSVVIIFSPSPMVNAGVDFTLCTNAPAVNLNATISGATTTGIWSGGNGTYSPDNLSLNAVYTPTAAEISTGTLFLTLTSSNNNNCNAENDNIRVDFIAPPFANFNLTNVCLNDSTVFTDFSLPGFGTITNWQWDFGDATTSNDQNNAHTYTQAGTYNAELIVSTSVGCTDTVSKGVTVFELPTANYTNTISCTGSQINIDFRDASFVNNDVINFWQYDFGGQGSSFAQNPSQQFVGSGNFTVTQVVGTPNGCLDTSIQTINIPDRPRAGFFYNTSNGLNIGAEFNFIDTSFNAFNYSWTFGDGESSVIQDPTHIYFANGTYEITQVVTDLLGCVDSSKQVIEINTVTTEIKTLIPNAISPNGDGKNDVWKLEFIEAFFPNASILIYNRWGQELFSSTGYDTPWDGTFSGNSVPDGTYYYVINLNEENQSVPFKGSILVLKSLD